MTCPTWLCSITRACALLPPTPSPAVRAAADYVCERAGGAGAFREVAELLLAGRTESGGQ